MGRSAVLPGIDLRFQYADIGDIFDTLAVVQSVAHHELVRYTEPPNRRVTALVRREGLSSRVTMVMEAAPRVLNTH